MDNPAPISESFALQKKHLNNYTNVKCFKPQEKVFYTVLDDVIDTLLYYYYKSRIIESIFIEVVKIDHFHLFVICIEYLF